MQKFLVVLLRLLNNVYNFIPDLRCCGIGSHEKWLDCGKEKNQSVQVRCQLQEQAEGQNKQQEPENSKEEQR